MQPCYDQCDPFVMAWGEIDGWRASEGYGHLLSGWSREIIDRAPEQSLKAARALAQSRALRGYLLEQIDVVTPKLRLQGLHRTFAAIRKARRGPLWWKRYWLRRAITDAMAVDEEMQTIAMARCQVGSWLRALDMCDQGLDQAAHAQWPSDLSVHALAERSDIVAALEDARRSLRQVYGSAQQLLECTNRLRRKAECAAEAAHAVPSRDEDVLNSPCMAEITGRARALPVSGLIGYIE